MLLVTGMSERSTLWLGDILGSVDSFEKPKDSLFHTEHGPKADYHFLHPEEDHPKHEHLLEQQLGFGSSEDEEKKSGLRAVYAKLRDSYKRKAKSEKERNVLVSQHSAVFFAPWLAERFKAEIVIVMEHPLHFVSDYIANHGRFDFEKLYGEEHLRKQYLSTFENELEDILKGEKDILEEACLLWNILSSVARQYRRAYPDWFFKKVEDFEDSSLRTFRELFDMLELPFGSETKERIRESVEASEAKHHISELDDSQRIQIKKLTEYYARFFYDDSFWDRR